MSRAQALAAGKPRYFTGLPCPRGHVTDRLVANWTCIDCINEKASEARKRHPMAAKRKDAARYWKDPEASRSKGLAQYQKHIDKRRAYNLERSKDPERHAATCRRALEYAKRHPGRVNALTARRRARLKQASPPWLTDDMIAEMRAIYEAARAAGHEVDHIVPLAGKTVCGLHVPWNLQILPIPDNRRKGNRHDAESDQ